MGSSVEIESGFATRWPMPQELHPIPEELKNRIITTANPS